MEDTTKHWQQPEREGRQGPQAAFSSGLLHGHMAKGSRGQGEEGKAAVLGLTQLLGHGAFLGLGLFCP